MIRATPARDLMATQTGGGTGDDPWIGHDPRLTLAREGGGPATGAGDVRRVQHGAVGLRAAADWGAGLLTELLYGETFAVHDEQDDWAWGQAAVDGYVGYLPRAVLGPPGAPPSHSANAKSSACASLVMSPTSGLVRDQLAVPACGDQGAIMSPQR